MVNCRNSSGSWWKDLTVYNKRLNHEFLWRNQALKLWHLVSGSEYDPNFYGGIDELLPNDIPEILDGVEYPDHGELWTSRLQQELEKDKISLHGKLQLSGISYRKTISLRDDAAFMHMDYKIKNESGEKRHFLWKLHAALAMKPGRPAHYFRPQRQSSGPGIFQI